MVRGKIVKVDSKKFQRYINYGLRFVILRPLFGSIYPRAIAS